jgi:repressor LexA
MPLTKRQREILNYLTAYTEQNGFAPSFEEIAENFDYNSLATVHEHLTNLERKGYIKRSYNESRAIEILPASDAARHRASVGGRRGGVDRGARARRD